MNKYYKTRKYIAKSNKNLYKKFNAFSIKKIIQDDIHGRSHIWAIFKRAHQYYYASLVDMIGPNSDPWIKSLYEGDGPDAWNRFECMIFEIDDRRFKPMQTKYKMGDSVYKDFCNGVTEDNLKSCIMDFHENFENYMTRAGYY